jgi:hypothetical protein
MSRWAPSFKLLTVTLALMFAWSGSRHRQVWPWASRRRSCQVSATSPPVAASTSMLQLSLDDAHRGLVMALWNLSFHEVRPVGSLADGFIASTVGLRAAAVVMAVPALIGAVGIALLRRMGVATELAT